MSTVSSSGSTIHGQEVVLQVRPIERNEAVSFKKVWSGKKLPISTRSAAENVDIRKLAYLADIDIPKIDANDVMLLIGTDSPEAHIPLEVRSGTGKQPYAIRSRLGWAIRGPIRNTSSSNVINVHFEESRDVLLQRQLERMWTTDFNDNKSDDKNLMSVEDKQALDIMESSITYEDGHYKLGLPWRDKNTSLTNNIAMAQARLQQLKRKLERDDTLHKMYTTTVNEYIEKGYAKRSVKHRLRIKTNVVLTSSSCHECKQTRKSTVTLRAKAIVQNLCRLKLGWDEQIPQHYCDEWKNWLTSLPCIESLSVNRCFRPKEFQHIKNAQLHLFSDGSELGYGACAYLRLVDGNDKITCSLIIGKARLAPIKQMSIPRLELSGAVTACRLYQILNDELEIKIDNVTFWTDSTIVLGYIRNTSRRFKTFVANRLSIIHNTTSLDQWRHVDSPSNPADIASRGIDACDSKKLNIWLNGPNFLLEDSRYWPQDLRNELQEVTENDTELKKEVAIHAMTNNTTDYLMNYFSDWTKLLRATAWLIRFKFYCRQRYLNHQVQCRTGDLTLSELKMATNVILVNVQSTCFKDEIIKLKKDTPVKKDSRIASLNPVLDNELIRAKGRLSTSNLDEYPIILPDNHHVTSLIVRFYHENQGHVGRQQVLAATRMKYWILKGPSLVKKVIGCCIPCKRQHSPL
ncbi:Hypothetical predicted protein [Mytilus galloprovincialis]|uniref:Integrase zinc-binding domain-containing protein n=1 Tax=Mytilus galloprovincialis TaxID=29158 RepID=A0A8B6EZP2_MYTGA|nr:Hypothetical predicted protein [Mytilus galloprovincialis]